MISLRRHPLHLVGAVLLVVAGVFGLTLAASAQQTENTLTIRDVDGADPDAVVVEFLYTGPRGAVVDLVLRENGRIVEHTPAVLLEESQEFGIVLAIDTSGSMEDNDAFGRAVEAASEFVANKQPTDRVALVAFSDTARVVEPFTTDADELIEAIEGLQADGGTALLDAVVTSANLFADTDLVANIVLLTDGTEANSTSSLTQATDALRRRDALLFAIGIESDSLDTNTLSALAGATGGVVTSAEATELSAIYAEVQSSLRRQFRTTFESVANSAGLLDLQLSIGTRQTTTSYRVAGRLQPGSEVEAIPAPEPGGIQALRSDVFVWAALVMAAIAVAGTVFAVGATVMGEKSTLDSVMQPYNEGYVAPDEESQGLVTSAFLQRAVELTGEFAERRGILVRVEEGLEQANLPLRAGETLFFYLAGLGLVFLLAVGLLANVVGVLLVMLIAVLLPPAIVSFLGSRRRKQFEAQLPDMLNLLASTLRAGYSMMQAVEAAAEETVEPMSKELKRVVTESRLGMPVEQAMDGVVARMKSKDFEWATMAIRIQREVGGNLAELLVTVADTMTQRERLRRDVSALTAEGRVSAMVLGLLPLGLGAAMFVINPDYIGGLFEDTIGQVMVGACLVAMAGGFFWMYKIIDIEV